MKHYFKTKKKKLMFKIFLNVLLLQLLFLKKKKKMKL